MMLVMLSGALMACSKEPASEASAGSAGNPSALTIAFSTIPDPPRSGENRVQVAVRDAAGVPVTDADVTAVFYMPAMPSMNMPEMRSSFPLSADGKGGYSGSGDLVMAGTWTATVNVSRAGQTLATWHRTVIAK
jgi:hypothetical protein